MSGRTDAYITPALGIHLVGGTEQYYVPGDTIHGNVFRGDHLVTPRARIRISLVGRSVSHAADTANARDVYYATQFDLFDESDTTQVLYDGPVHIEHGGAALWPFELTIPLTASAVALSSSGGQKSSHHPFGSNVPGSLRLPLSFDGNNIGLFDFGCAFVEYVLVAELSVFSHKSGQIDQATQPIELKSGAVVRPLEDWRLRTKTLPWSVTSYGLVPDMQDTGLSLSQQARRLFHSSKVPTFLCSINVDMPTTIQLENPAPIPIHIHARPRCARTSEAIRDIPQQIRLRGMSIVLEIVTEVKAMGSVVAHYGIGRNKTDLEVDAAISALGTDVLIPCNLDGPPLDLGTSIAFRIGKHGRIGQTKRSPCQIYPTSTVFNIKRTYRFHWTVKLSLAGKDEKFSGSQGVMILPPIKTDEDSIPGQQNPEPATDVAPPLVADRDGSQTQKTANDDAPPTFTETIQENEVSIEGGSSTPPPYVLRTFLSKYAKTRPVL